MLRAPRTLKTQQVLHAVFVVGIAAGRMPPALITDQGDPTRPRGWFDAQCQGATNDYCRWVGNPAYWSCALAGSFNQYSRAGQFSYLKTSAVPCSPAEATAQGSNDAGMCRTVQRRCAGSIHCCTTCLQACFSLLCPRPAAGPAGSAGLVSPAATTTARGTVMQAYGNHAICHNKCRGCSDVVTHCSNDLWCRHAAHRMSSLARAKLVHVLAGSAPARLACAEAAASRPK